MSTTQTGVVKWFNDGKGFGFISGNGGQDIFVHHTSIIAQGYRSLKEGDAVEYELEPGPKGLKAINVRRVAQTDVSGPLAGFAGIPGAGLRRE